MAELTLEALQAVTQSDPKSLDLALLDPLREQLEAAQEAGIDDPLVDALKAAVDTLVGEQITRLNALAAELTDDWQKAVKARRPITDRWIDDERQFNGKTRVRASKAYPSDAADTGLNQDEITVHATRSRTLMCWGRMADMMLPANDFPMRVDAADEPDPAEFPTLQQAIQEAMSKAQAGAQQGQPVPPPDPKEILHDLSEQAANTMQARVFQMLRDAKFASAARQALYDCARLGTGILKGPFPTLKQTRKFRPDAQEFDLQETPTAGICRVDPWLFWYDMAPSLERASATYEVQLLSKRELADFKRYPRVITSVIDELLKEDDPQLDGEFRSEIARRNEYTDQREPLDGVYALLETHKVLDPKKLKDCMGIDWPHADMPVVHLWSVNGKCVKWKLSPLERDFRLDYYNFTIMPADDTIFGYGYPYLARAAQRFADGAVRATLNNAGASVAPMLLVAKGKVQPNREQWRVAGLNVFSIENGDQPIENFMAAVQVPSNVQQNLELLKVAQDMMDQDTLFNQLLQGNISGEEMPASGLVTLSNISSVFQRAIASYADDHVFQPLCERLIWWAKMYDGRPELMGDMQAKAIASTQLVSKDLALQHTQALIAMMQNPMFAGFGDAYEAWKAFTSNIDGLPNRDAIIKDRDRALADQAAIQQMQQQGDPNQAAKLASDERIAMAKLQSAERQAQASHQAELLAIQGRLRIAELTLQARMVELQQQKDVDITKISAELQKAARDDDTRRFQAVLDGQIKASVETAKLNASPSPYSRLD